MLKKYNTLIFFIDIIISLFLLSCQVVFYYLKRPLLNIYYLILYVNLLKISYLASLFYMYD